MQTGTASKRQTEEPSHASKQSKIQASNQHKRKHEHVDYPGFASEQIGGSSASGSAQMQVQPGTDQEPNNAQHATPAFISTEPAQPAIPMHTDQVISSLKAKGIFKKASHGDLCSLVQVYHKFGLASTTHSHEAD